MPLFTVSLNTSRDLLVFFFVSWVALIPAQLMALFVPRTQHPLSPEARFLPRSCWQPCSLCSQKRTKFKLEHHAHLEKLWTLLQLLAKPGITFCLCTRVGTVQNVTEAFGFSEKYWQNLCSLNCRIPDYRSVQSEERELIFHFGTQLQTKHYSYSRGRQHCQSNPALHGHLSTINSNVDSTQWVIQIPRQSEGHNRRGTGPSYWNREEGNFACNSHKNPAWMKSCLRYLLPRVPSYSHHASTQRWHMGMWK